MTDCVLFASVFATYAVLVHHTAGGPAARTSSSCPTCWWKPPSCWFPAAPTAWPCSLRTKGAKGQAIAWLGVTFLLGAAFIGMEINEFHHLIAEGFGPSRSAFLSSFFTLVGMHGLHVSAGLLWMLVLMAQIWTRGLTAQNNTRMMCLSLFWHFLDIVWICVFTVVSPDGGPVMSSAAHDNHGAGHGSLGSYAIGFVLSVILTAIPFYMVMDGGFSRHATILTMVVLGLVQVVVHLICFLHMNMSSEGRWNVMAFIFTVIVILLVVGLAVDHLQRRHADDADALRAMT